jgi:succinate dehydrogenase / fumarate reductase cytochrome b subunit
MASRQRPLSPHLQVYRWQVQMVTSILHRATGVVLSVGALLIAAAIVALLGGPQAWDWVRAAAGSPFGLVFLFLWVWTFSFHLLNGIRHLVQDVGLACTLPALVASSWMALIGSVIVTLALFGYAAMRGGLL